MVEPAAMHLHRTATGQRFAVIAYCFMPDHLHVLAQGSDEAADFKQFVRMFKQHTGFDWKRHTGRQLWQRRYFERVLRADEDTVAIARYILANPVRAGLVQAPSQYPFLGSFTLPLGELIGSVQMDGRRT